MFERGEHLPVDENSTLAGRLRINGASLPGWAGWLLALGHWMRRSGKATEVVSISVPARGYGAAFLMAGVHDAGASDVSPVSLDTALKLIKDWGIGANVSFEWAGTRREGTILNISDDRVEIRTDAVSTYGVPRDKVLGIDLLPDGVAPRTRRRGKAELSLRSALYPGDPIGRIGSSRIECLVVGQKTSLEEDLQLQVSAVGFPIPGTLGELVKPLSLATRAGAFRTDVISFSSDQMPSQATITPPNVVVLDGSLAVLEWLPRVSGYPTVALIDRAEARAEDAAAMLLEKRAAAGASDLPRSFPTPPLEIELLYYNRAAS